MITIEVPIKTVSEANNQEHWTKKSKRHSQQQFFVRHALKKNNIKINLPCSIKLTRLAPRILDDDNLPVSMKYIRDEIAAYIFPEKVITYKRNGKTYSNKGNADSDPQVTWLYSQEKLWNYSVRIEIKSKEKNEDNT